jgi:hypothetical protein
MEIHTAIEMDVVQEKCPEFKIPIMESFLVIFSVRFSR